MSPNNSADVMESSLGENLPRLSFPACEAGTNSADSPPGGAGITCQAASSMISDSKLTVQVQHTVSAGRLDSMYMF